MNEDERQEELTAATDHFGKIGMVVRLYVDGKDGREIYTGVLHCARDKFNGSRDIERTILTVGTERVVLDWGNDDILTALIEPR